MELFNHSLSSVLFWLILVGETGHWWHSHFITFPFDPIDMHARHPQNCWYCHASVHSPILDTLDIIMQSLERFKIRHNLCSLPFWCCVRCTRFWYSYSMSGRFSCPSVTRKCSNGGGVLGWWGPRHSSGLGQWHPGFLVAESVESASSVSWWWQAATFLQQPLSGNPVSWNSKCIRMNNVSIICIPRRLNRGIKKQKKHHFTPRFNEVERGVYWFHFVRPSVSPSVCPSVRLWTESCPLHNISRIHFIFTHLIKQLQKVCHV